jgi:hypothetical protein
MKRKTEFFSLIDSLNEKKTRFFSVIDSLYEKKTRFFFAILKGHRNCARMKEASNWISLKKRKRVQNCKLLQKA